MTHRKPNRLLWLAAFGIALQAIVPAGYMPAPISGGLPFVLCPGGMSGAAFFIADSTGSRHGDGHEQSHGHVESDSEPSREWQFCPLGAMFGAPALTADFQEPSPAPERQVSSTDTVVVARSAFIRTWRARAPPTRQLIVV